MFNRRNKMIKFIDDLIGLIKNKDVADKKYIIEMAIKNGVDINAVSSSGETLLMAAAEENELDIVFLLIDNGADVHAKDKDGKTALMKATSVQVARPLVCHAGVNDYDNNGNVALHFYVARGDFAMVKFLVIECGADVNARNNKAETPLMFSTDYEICDFLIQHSADVNAKDMYNRTSLMRNNGDAIADLLVAHKADVNAKDYKNRPALFYKATYGDVASSRVLIDNGADVNAVDDHNRDVYAYAKVCANKSHYRGLCETYQSAGKYPTQASNTKNA